MYTQIYIYIYILYIYIYIHALHHNPYTIILWLTLR